MVLEERNELTIFVITGKDISKQFFITEAGKGSRLHDLSTDFQIHSFIEA